jgi:hypothetical protein
VFKISPSIAKVVINRFEAVLGGVIIMRIYPSPYAGSGTGGGCIDLTAADTVPTQLAGGRDREQALGLATEPHALSLQIRFS